MLKECGNFACIIFWPVMRHFLSMLYTYIRKMFPKMSQHEEKSSNWFIYHGRERTLQLAVNQEFNIFSQLCRKHTNTNRRGVNWSCCFVSVNTRGLMGFHDYPPWLDTANLPHILVYRWRILMKSRQAGDIRYRLVKRHISCSSDCRRVNFSLATEQRKGLVNLGLVELSIMHETTKWQVAL